MSDKAWEKLNPLDQRLKRLFVSGMREGVDCTISLIIGFELFNTRAYHNYETWGQGYRVEGAGVVVEREDLDDAIEAFAQKIEAARAAKEKP